MEKPKTSETGPPSDASQATNLSGENSPRQASIPKVGPDESTEPVEAADEEYKYITGFKLAIVIVSVTLVAFLFLLDTTIIVTAIPQITTDFHSLNDVGWYGSAYLLANCALQPLTGQLYTYFSSKFIFLSFLAIFELGSLLCGIATSSNMLIAGRAVAGMGASGLTNGALTIISAVVPLAKRPVYFGIMMSTAQLAVAFGPLIGGALTQYTTWRWCFYVNLPTGGAVAVLLMLIQIPDRTIKGETEMTLWMKVEKLDLLGFAFFAPAAFQVLLALEWGGTRYLWSSPTIIGLFCGAAATFGVFLTWEYRRGDAAMIPFSMVRLRIVWVSCLVTCFLTGTLLITSYYLPIYFQAVRDATPTLSGIDLLPGILSSMLFAVVSGVLVGRLGYYLPWSIASGVLTSIGSGLISLFTPTTSIGTWIGFQIIGGAGRGCGQQIPIVAIQNALPQEQLAIGITFAIFVQTFGGAVFLTLAQTVFNYGLVDAISTYAPEISPETVVNAGATAVRDVVPESSIAGVLLAYNQAVSHTFYLAAGAAVATFVLCWGMGWKSVKTARAIRPEA